MERLEKTLANWGGAELKEINAETIRALARLDADRLEQIALSCHGLDSRRIQLEIAGHRELERDMAVLARVLEMTRTNLCVLRRAARTGQLEYPGTSAEGRYGDN